MRNNQKLWKYGAYVHNGNTIDESIDKVIVISNDSKYAIREEIYNYANKYFIDGISTIPIDHLYNNLVRKFRGPLNRNSDNGIINPGNRFYAISVEYIHVGLWDYQDNKMKLIDLENGANMQKIERRARTKFMSALDSVIIYYIHSIIHENSDWMEWFAIHRNRIID
jgi:hypothetical protein